MTFTYSTIQQGVGVIACFIGMNLFDRVGRRPILIVGCLAQVVFMCVIAGVGGKSNATQTDAKVVVAAVCLFVVAVKISLSSNSYLISAEIGGVRLRKKIMAWGTSWVSGPVSLLWDVGYCS